MKKKLIATSLVASLAVTPFAGVGIFATSVQAASNLTQQERQLIERIQALHTALADVPADQAAVHAALENFRALTNDGIEAHVDSILADTSVANSPHKNEIVNFIASLTGIYYSDNLDASLLNVKDSTRQLRDTLGVSLTSAQTLTFVQDFESEFARTLNVGELLGRLLLENPKQQVAGYLSQHTRNTLTALVGDAGTQYPEVRQALITALGDDFINQFVKIKQNLEGHIDTEAQAQVALAKAYVRSETKVYNAAGTTEITNGLSVKQAANVQFQLKAKAASLNLNLFEVPGLSVQVFANGSDVASTSFTTTILAGGVAQIAAAENTALTTGYTVKVTYSFGGRSFLVKSIPLTALAKDPGDSPGNGGGGGGTPVNEVVKKASDLIKDLLKDGKLTGSELKDLIKQLKKLLKDASAEDTKKVLEAILNELKTADVKNKSKLEKAAIFVADLYVQKSAEEELKATVTDGKAQALPTEDQLKKVTEKLVKAITEVNDLLASANIKNAKLSPTLTLKVADAANNTEIKVVISQLAAALNGKNVSPKVKFQIKGASVTLDASDVLGALTAKESVTAAAEADEYALEIVQSDSTDAPGANLKGLSGVKVVEVKATSKGKEVTSFKQAAQIEIEVGTLPSGTNEDKVAAYQLVDGKWVAVGGVYEDGILTFKTNKPGKFTVFVSNKSFADLGSVAWAQTQVESMVAKGVIYGRSETKFAPNEKVTRAEFATLLVRAFGLYEENANSEFSDVKSSGWFHAGVASAAKHGIVSGVSAGKFNPNAPVTRAEMATMAANALKKLNEETAEDTEATLAAFADNGNIPSWAKDAVALAVENDIIKGMGNSKFAPNDNATRAQAAVVIYGLYKNQN